LEIIPIHRALRACALSRGVNGGSSRRQRAEFPRAPPGLPVDDIERRNIMSMKIKLAITTAAVLAAFAGPTLADSYGHDSAKARAIRYAHSTSARASVEGGTSDRASTPYNSPAEFSGYSTEYLMNRFADRQLQGR